MPAMIEADHGGPADGLPRLEDAGPPRTVLPKRCPKCGERFPADFRVCPRDAIELEAIVGGVNDPYLGSTLANSYRWSLDPGLPRHWFVDAEGTVVREVVGPLAPGRMVEILEELIGPAPA